MPPWLRALDRWLPAAPTTHIDEERDPATREVVGYTIGGRGWHDGGRDRVVHPTRLGAAVATWEWWLTTEPLGGNLWLRDGHIVERDP